MEDLGSYDPRRTRSVPNRVPKESHRDHDDGHGHEEVTETRTAQRSYIPRSSELRPSRGAAGPSGRHVIGHAYIPPENEPSRRRRSEAPPRHPDEQGYGVIAREMNKDADQSMYRRFGYLNTRNLLLMQSELAVLEERLRDMDRRCSNNSEHWNLPRSWHYIEEDDGEYLDLVLEIRRKLAAYNKALETQAWLLGLKAPDDRSRACLTKVMDTHKTEMLRDDAKFIMSACEDLKRDLVALSTSTSEPLTGFLGDHFPWLFEDHERRGATLAYFSEDKIKKLVRVLAIIMSAVFPIVSIIALYFIRSQAVRLGCIVAFSVLCSVVLALTTDASNAEISGITAAYAAIQVVFVSGGLADASNTAA